MNRTRTIWCFLSLLLSPLVSAAQIVPVPDDMDSVEISLITCSPHEEIYSLYGHTALRYHDRHATHPQDIALNWGIFNFKAPHFALRFVFGLTDYELGAADFVGFCEYYRRWGSGVTEQVLNLTADEKRAVAAAVSENMRPENRVYRYNYFYDNCSTRPRDIIERCVAGRLVYSPRADYSPTYREMIRQKTAHHAWATFGNDMLLGLRADLGTTREEQEFLPENLLYDFDHAEIAAADGSRRPLVKERRVAVAPQPQTREPDFPLTPMQCAVLLLLLSLAMLLWEWRRGKTFKYWDVALMLLAGLPGCVLTVMLFSQHPATTLNLQLLLFNPVHLFFLPAVVRRRPTRYWCLLGAMIGLFAIGAFFQDYAEGTAFLALCLLTRLYSHLRISNSTSVCLKRSVVP